MKRLNIKDGMPNIAELVKERHFRVGAGMLAVVLVVSIAIWFKSGKPEQHELVSGESYTVAHDKVITKRKKQQGSTPLVEHQMRQEAAQEMQASAVQAKAKVLQMRLSAPLMLVNSIIENKEIPVAQKNTKLESNPNKRFMQKVSSQSMKPVEASNIGNLSMVIAQGSFIHAIMEPAANSDLPGSLRAIVSEPVYSENGSRVLIPRGSRLIGEYKSGMQQGQSRIFIVWNRLITPLGVSLQLGSEGVDRLGVAGVGADDINRHFWQRFGTASLLSMIGIGAGGSGNDIENSISSYRSAVASSFSQSANQSLQQDNNIAPTLKTWQGKPIMVFVGRDLQFANAMQNIKSSLFIF